MKKEIKEDKYFIYDSPLPKRNAIKKLALQLLCHFYKVKMNRNRPKVIEKKKYYVSIGAIFKNESPYIQEWIEYNHAIGIDHFYMYDNNSSDDFLSVLQPYIETGLVTLIPWKKDHAQMEAYADMVKRFSGETNWIGFIDLDELIVPIKQNNIKDFLLPFEKNRGSVLIYWKMFTSSGKLERNPHGFFSEDFIVCWPKLMNIGKCFYNTAYEFVPEYEKNKTFHHMLYTRYNNSFFPPVNAEDNVCIKGINRLTNESSIQINHYFTKSYSEYIIKKNKGDVYFQINPHDEAYFFEHEMKSTDVDYSAYKYLIKMKLAIENNEDKHAERN